MTLTEAKQLKQGQWIYSTIKFNVDKKTPMRARVTSIKTWKRSPDRVEVHVKHGLRDYCVFTESELSQIKQ